MIQLIAYTQANDTPIYLDVNDGAAVSLNMAFCEPSKPLTRSSTYSASFTLPVTKNNGVFFSHFYEVNLTDGSFDSRKRARVIVASDGVPVMEGFLQLLGFSTKSQTYECSVVGGAGDVFSKLADITLGSLFNGDYDTVANASNVINSWTLTNDVTSGGVGAGLIVFPYADYGKSEGGRLFYEDGVQDGIALPFYARSPHFKPALQLDHIVRTIIESTGKTIVSTFMATADWLKIFIVLNTEQSALMLRPYYGTKAGITGDLAINATGLTTVLFTDTTSTGLYDPDNHMAAGTFQSPTTMNAAFEVALDFVGTGSVAYADVIVTRASNIVLDQAVIIPAGGLAFSQIIENIYVGQGEDVQVAVLGYPSGSISDSANTFFRFIEFASEDDVGAVVVASALPNVKASEFLSDIAKRFNLAIVSQNNDPDSLVIEPLHDYISSGQSLDWTGKVNHDAALNVKPTTPLKVKELLFTDGTDNDHMNKWFNSQIGGSLGDYTHLSEDEFASGSSVTPMLTGSTGMFYLPRQDLQSTDLANVAIPMYYGSEGPVTTKPKLLFYNELVTGAFPTSVYIDSTAHTAYPHFSPFSDRVIDGDTWSLLWRDSYRFSSHVIGGLWSEGLIRKFWSQYLQQIYSPDARLLECEVMLDAGDIYTLSFADTIAIQNGLYRVLDISAFNADEGGKTKVRLLKIIDQAPHYLNFETSCTLRLTGLLSDGTTSWEDSAGSAVSPTEECCDAEGYTYHNGACWWNWVNPSGGGTSVDGTIQPASITHGIGYRPPPPISTTDTQATRIANARFPYAAGTKTITSSAPLFNRSQQQRYLLQGTTHSTTAQVLTPFGRAASEMYIPSYGTAEIRVSAVGTDIAGTSVNVGDYALVEQFFYITNTGTVGGRVQEDHNVQKHHSGGHANATLSINITTGNDARSGQSQLVQLMVTGVADTITQWSADVQVTYTSLLPSLSISNAVVTEDQQIIQLENSSVCITQG